MVRVTVCFTYLSGMQRAAILPSMASLVPPNFWSPHKRNDFQKKLVNKKCVFWLSLQFLFETFLTRRKIQPDIVKNAKSYSCKVPVILVGFSWNFSPPTDFRKKLKYQISPKSIQWEKGCSMRRYGQADGRTDMTKLTVAFRNFGNAPKSFWSHRKSYKHHSVMRWQSRTQMVRSKQKTEGPGWHIQVRGLTCI
jgi:hypothetical protein